MSYPPDSPPGGQWFTLPSPPSVNHYWRTVVRNGRPTVLVTDAGAAYKRHAWLTAAGAGIRPLSGPVGVRLVWYRPARRGDADNILKGLLDSVSGIAYHDDSQIAELHVYRYEDKAYPRVEVTVWPLPQNTQDGARDAKLAD